jgi:formylglycine-generating enzyme required for sulfatase activity
MSRHLLLPLCAWVLGLAGAASGLLAQPPAPPKKTALLARAFDNQRRDLAAQAAQRFSAGRLPKELLRLGWDVRILQTLPKEVVQPPAGEVPTEANLRASLKGLGPLRRDDEVIVVLIGHLIALDAEAGKGGRRYYYCPQDASYQGLKKVAEVKAKHRLLALEEIYAALRACPARKKLLVLVTALTGGVKARDYPPPLCAVLPELPPPPEGVALLTSCEPGEFTSPHVRFLDLFGERLEKARPGVTMAGLLDQLRKDVTAKGKSLGPVFSARQHPRLLGGLPREWALTAERVEPAWPLLTAPFSAKAARERQEQLAKRLKLDAPVLTNAVGMKLVLIPPGECLMGSAGGYPDERPAVRVRLARPFLLGQHEVTQGQYQRLMGANPSHFKQVAGQDTSAFPVEQVTYKEMVLFCNALSERDKLPPYYALLGARRDPKTGRVTDFGSCTPTRGPGYRLPTEAEWEYACRAGTTTVFHFGETADGRQANLDSGRPGGVRPGAYLGRTTKVGSYAANAFGLHDMHGNVWEMCEDRYDPGRYKALAGKVADGSPHESGGGLARGGAWNFEPVDCRAAVRLPVFPDRGLKYVGFRVARNAE